MSEPLSIAHANAPVIDYATPHVDIRARHLLIIARWMAGLPMAVGVSCLIGFAITGWFGFAITGYFTLFGGFAAFVIGCICLSVYYGLNRLPNSPMGKQVWQECTTCMGFLIANFPVAVVCVILGMALVKNFH